VDCVKLRWCRFTGFYSGTYAGDIFSGQDASGYDHHIDNFTGVVTRFIFRVRLIQIRPIITSTHVFIDAFVISKTKFIDQVGCLEGFCCMRFNKPKNTYFKFL